MFLLPFVLIFLVIFTFFLHRHDHTFENRREAFLEREREANNTRRKNIDNLDYITVPIDRLPFDENASPEIARLQNTVRRLSEQKILNLGAYSNTELKLTYGAANLETLSAYDDNYTNLTQALATWGDKLMKAGQTESAVQVLEYGIRCKTTISSNYYTLATYYADTNQKQRIEALKAQAAQLPSLMSDTIVKRLESIMENPATAQA